MDDDWDADDFVPPPPVVLKEQPKSQWDDEDKEEEEEPPVNQPPPQTHPVIPKPKAEKKDKGKKSLISKKEAEEEKQSSDPVADKLKQQRIEEEADYKVTAELFKKESDGKSLEEFIPKSEADFLEYAELVSQKITPFQKSFHYMALLKAIIKNASSSFKAAEAKELASAVTVLANEKLKAEKEAGTGKKKGGVKKKQLIVDKVEEDTYTKAYDDADDDDFM